MGQNLLQLQWSNSPESSWKCIPARLATGCSVLQVISGDIPPVLAAEAAATSSAKILILCLAGSTSPEARPCVEVVAQRLAAAAS